MKNDIASLTAQLEESLKHITAELETLGVHDPQNQKDWVATPSPESMEPDPNDAADRVEEWDEHAAILAPLERQYNDVTRALQKIGKGTYGICEIGNEEIEADRLSANPAARTCKAHMEEEATLPQ